MARVNVENGALGDRRLDRLARKLGISRRHAFGHLVFMWEESQELLRAVGTRDEIAEWFGAFDLAPNVGADPVTALASVGYITERGDDWEIVGNRKQIDEMMKFSAGRIKGGEATKAKWLKLRDAEGSKPSSKPSSNHGSDQAQCKAMQGKETHTSVDATDPPTPAFGPRELAAAWNIGSAICHPKVDVSRLKPGSPRWRRAASRLADEPDPAYWREVIKRLAAWPHGRGESPGKNGAPPWLANFDYLVQPDTHVKASEGNFGAAQKERPRFPGRNLAE